MHGKVLIKSSEIVVKSCSSAEDVVAKLVIDDGIEKRGNRSNLFDDSYKVAGCFALMKEGKLTVCIEYAAGFVHKGEKNTLKE